MGSRADNCVDKFLPTNCQGLRTHGIIFGKLALFSQYSDHVAANTDIMPNIIPQHALKATAGELGITPQILTRWRRERVVTPGTPAVSRAQVSQEQQEIVHLKKELTQAELDQIAEATRYLKTGGRHLLQERPHRRTGEIFRFVKAHQAIFTTVRRCG